MLSTKASVRTQRRRQCVIVNKLHYRDVEVVYATATWRVIRYQYVKKRIIAVWRMEKLARETQSHRDNDNKKI